MDISFCILFFPRHMNTAINLHDQARRMAIKINDKTINDLLTAKV